MPTTRVDSRPVALLAALLVLLGLVTCSPAREPVHGNAARVLIDQGEVFPAVLALIAGAEREILFSMYLFGGDQARGARPPGIGRQIVDALVERRRAGVDVRVINTPFNPVDDPRPEHADDDEWFHPVYDYAAAQGLPIVRPAVAKGGIDHTKYLVVDGRDAIFGGMNLADAVASNHDVMVWVTGPIVAHLHQVFAASWADAIARAGAAAPVLPPLAPPAADALAESAGARLAEGFHPCAIDLRTTAPNLPEIRPALLTALASAGPGDSLRVALLLLGEPGLVDALIAAHRRGARVRVILDPGEAFYGVDCRGSLNAEALAALADAGVEVRHYRARPGQEMHMKVMVLERADGERLFTLGSANWTGSDMFKNREVTGIFTACDGPAAALADLFDADWQAHTRPLDPALVDRYRDPAERQRLSAACGDLLKRTSWLRGRR